MAQQLVFGSLEAQRQALILRALSLEDGTGKCNTENEKLHGQLIDQIREISNKILGCETEENTQNDDLLRPWIKFSDQIPQDEDVCDVQTDTGIRTLGIKFSAEHGMFLTVVMSATKITATCYFADSWRLSKNA